jgi:mRNA-degrading endonuclease toxin of MazEF toxin-antitoxin module
LQLFSIKHESEFNTSKVYDALGNLWLVASQLIRFQTSHIQRKNKNRPVVSILPMNSGRTFVTPGTSQPKTEKDIVRVSTRECPELNRNTSFLVRLTQPISTKNLWNYLGALPDDRAEELREKVVPVLPKEYRAQL